MELVLASDLEKVFDRIAQAGVLGGHSSGVFIPAPGRPGGPFFDHVVQPNFRQAGVEMTLLNLTQTSPSDVEAQLRRANLLYVGGGNTFRLLQRLKAAGVAQHLPEFFRRGGLYHGSSVGAVVAGPDIAFIACLDDNSAVQLRDCAGLNLVGFNLLPHIDHPQYREAARQADLRGQPTIGLRDDQWLHVCRAYVEIR